MQHLHNLKVSVLYLSANQRIPELIEAIFKNTVRNMRKIFVFLLLNTGGLAIGLTGFMFITLYVIHQLSYYKVHRNYENNYRVIVPGLKTGGETDMTVTGNYPDAPTVLLMSC